MYLFVYGFQFFYPIPTYNKLCQLINQTNQSSSKNTVSQFTTRGRKKGMDHHMIEQQNWTFFVTPS